MSKRVMYELFRLAELKLIKRVDKIAQRQCSENEDYIGMMHNFVWRNTNEGYEYWSKIHWKIANEFNKDGYN